MKIAPRLLLRDPALDSMLQTPWIVQYGLLVVCATSSEDAKMVELILELEVDTRFIDCRVSKL